jgi:hypothetical protein
MARLTDAELDLIAMVVEVTPPGPWYPLKVLHCHQLVAGAIVDPDGKLRPIYPSGVVIVLETHAGRLFLERCRADVVALLEHAEALENEMAELRARLNEGPGGG